MEKKLEDEAATKEDMRDVHTLVQDARTIWPTLSLERQRRYIRLTTQSIELDVLAEGWLILFVRWSPYMGYDATDVAIIWRQRGAGKVWTETENSILERSYSTASRGWILDQLPSRSWESIRAQAFKQGCIVRYSPMIQTCRYGRVERINVLWTRTS